MYQINEYVMTAQDGLCQIKGITKKDFSGIEKDYYEMCPVTKPNAISFVPVENNGRVRLPITKEEAEQILNEFDTIEPIKIKSDKLRGDLYKEVTKRGDVRECIALWKTLYFKKLEQAAVNKTLRMLDDKYYRHICSYLYHEMAYALGSSSEEIEKMLTGRL